MKKNVTLTLTLCTILFAVIKATAQPQLVKEINTNPIFSSSNPNSFVRVGNKTVFIASTQKTGKELWVTDGTGQGTTLVKDMYPGPLDGISGPIVGFNGEAYFTTATGLWKTNGTPGGTIKIKDGAQFLSIDLSGSLVVNGVLFFKASDSNNGLELWKTDGTDAGTVLVKNIQPISLGSNPANFTNVNGTLFFTAETFSEGLELWKSNGTGAGTVIVKDIIPGSTGSNVQNLVNVNGTLFFSARAGGNLDGVELWKSNGTAAGTVQVKNINPSGDSNPMYLTNVNGVLFFTAYDDVQMRQIWKSDGTEAGTQKFATLTWTVDPKDLINANGTIFFSASTHSNKSMELWKTDGIGISSIEQIGTSSSSAPNYFTALNGIVYFNATNSQSGFKNTLWRSNGTLSGTIMLRDVNGSPLLNPTGYVNINDTLFFAAHPDDVTTGFELYRTNGTQVGTTMVKDISVTGNAGSNIKDMISAGSQLYFKAGTDFWKTDGTESGTKQLLTNAGPSYMAEMNGLIFYINRYTELWKTDGTEAGTQRVIDTSHQQPFNIPQNLVSVNGTLFFMAEHVDYGYELWKTDGTEAGTMMVKDIYPGVNSSLPSSMINANGTLFFFAQDDRGQELWKSDGTEAGTVLVKDVYEGVFSGTSEEIVMMGNDVYFSGVTEQEGAELWKSDGTEAGTVMVKAINPGDAHWSSPRNFTAVNNTLFFTAFDANIGDALWKTDGTAAGTVLVKDIHTGNVTNIIGQMVNADGTLFFAADDGFHGLELWKSDGTVAGTVMVKDLFPGAMGGTPKSLQAAKGNVYFRANDGTGFGQLWKSNGTEAGTSVIASFAFGLFDNNAPSLAKVGNRLYFNANDSTHGEELWVYEYCTPENHVSQHWTCNSFTWPVNNKTYYHSIIDTVSYINASGCDSLLILDLSIDTVNRKGPVFNVSVCQSYTWSISGETYTSSIVDTAWYLNASGCDSVVILNLTIDTVNTNVNVSGTTLSAEATNATFRWLNCDLGYAFVMGETSGSFEAPDFANYAVEVTQNGCVDTSDCYSTLPSSVFDLSALARITLYPNPVKETFTVELGKTYDEAEIKVTDMVGRTVIHRQLKNTAQAQVELKGSAGVYLVEMTTPAGIRMMKVVKE